MKGFEPVGSRFLAGEHLLRREMSAYERMQETISRSFGGLSSVQHALEEQRRWDRIRKVLDPLEELRRSLGLDSGWRKAVDELSSVSAQHFSRAFVENQGILGIVNQLHQSTSWSTSLQHARDTFAATRIANPFIEAQRAFHTVQRHWVLPHQLVESIGALAALQEEIGRLTLPVIDWNSAAALAQFLGPEGLQEELAALGIGEDGGFTRDVIETGDGGFLTPKQRDLLTILSLVLALLIPLYQEWSSAQSQIQTDQKLDSQTVMLERQAKQLESLSVLVEQALIKETARASTRFVVLDRVAVVRTRPQSGSPIEGKLLPREVVTMVSERGKWIEVRYYHWILKEYQTGWTLKKYFARVPSAYKAEG